MATEAILFDLFGTLVPAFSRRRHDAVLESCATHVGLPTGRLADLSAESYGERVLGRSGDFVEQLAGWAADHGLAFGPEQETECRRSYREFVRTALTPSASTVDALRTLTGSGVRLVLVSNANPDVARAWPASPLARYFDGAVFSCEVGVAKPDPLIYRHALGLLPPSARSLFVGDGSDHELEGAAAVGLEAILLTADLSDAYDDRRAHLDGWTGPGISALAELVDLIRIGRAS